MSAPAGTIKLSNGTTVKVACHACGQPATQSVIIKLCRDCSSQCKSQRKHELENDEDDAQNPEESELMDTTPDEFEHSTALDHSDAPQDVQLKPLDREVNDCGFDGHGTTLVQCCLLGDGRKLVSTGFMEETPLDTVEMLPSLVNYPLNYCRDSQEAGALIATWLAKSLHQIQVLFTKQGVFLGPHFAAFQLQIIACRLEQIVEYGIKDDRWRADRIFDERVRGYRMASKQYEAKCKELRQKIKSWDVSNADNSLEFDGIKDSIARIEGLSAQILNAKRPVPEPKVSAVFEDLSIAAPNVSTDNPQNSTSVKAQKTQPSSIFAPHPKRAPNRAQEPGRKDENKNKPATPGSTPRGLCLPFKSAPSQADPHQSSMEGMVLDEPQTKNPTPQQNFYASAQPKKTMLSSSL
ncbi:hypothetical protein M409DRAFT_60207 [Zasmidium cellare ATCC 36951]|uniref:Uncharacterized protein n=1 Tax=Zasmidium cellare ATCC 36951 TaxID=1080233 RepID=A0A6A6C3X6_ZASCE|nr:uncharacterized protein M409DRAFT_60207 [Zasmidium cellare ATCC 36951]KAF2160096.1 hypothetical protein M409DRAFT_60207 [Zasmidium cellare ATCC 36951]